jgi:hypothetical protein
MLVILVLKSSEKWRVERAQFSSFVCKSMLPAVLQFYSHSFQHYQSKFCDQFIETDIQ